MRDIEEEARRLFKKGEIKITVVATGFNNDNPAPIRPATSGFGAPIESNQNLFESISKSSSHQNQNQQNNSNTPSQPVKEFVDEGVNDSEFDTIPAFIRRKMNK